MDPNFYYTFNGKIIHDLSEVPENAILQKNPRLCGGKGGFGSMLRAIGSQIEKTTNREMCRDLNGRRMRDVNNEKKLKEWLDKSESRERDKIVAYLEKRRQRKLLLEQGPSSKPFEDKTRDEQRKQIAEELQEAINEAFENRKLHESNSKAALKPKKYKIDVDSDLDSSSCSSSSSPSSPSYVRSEPETVENVIETIKSSSSESETKLSESIQEECNEPPSKLQKCDNEEPIAIIPTEVEYHDINLDKVGSATHLLTFGADWIKHELMRRGLKCGGTLMERSERLFSVKGLDKYPEHLLAGATKRKRKL